MLRLLEAQENPLDQPVPDINVPVLTPQPPSRVQRFKEYAADKRHIFKKICKLQMERSEERRVGKECRSRWFVKK